ncbi:MAG TPA: CsbD family protein [Gemmatimonadales bacterium]|nr:CsbD family protein [Gemmatimonadales bacterium]
MNRDWLEGNWKQVRGKVRERWGKLTDDELDVIAGRRDQLVGRIQELYGTSKHEIERDLDDLEHPDTEPRPDTRI